MRPLFLLFNLVACSLLALPAHGERPNVILFLVDDMGWIDSTPYGSQYYETPNIMRLANQSMRFTDAYAVPLCSPTRATILSGQYSARHGVTSASGHLPARSADASRYPEKASPTAKFIYPTSKNFLDPQLIVLPEVLRSAGYRTGHFGKWHMGIAPQHRPDQHGFETTWFCVPDPGPPSYFSPYGVTQEGNAGGRQKVGTITDGPEGEYITDRLTDEAVRFIKTHRNEPFYLNLCQYAVHGPWGHKTSYTETFADKTDPRGKQKNPIMASMLKSVDESLGRVLDTLDELGLTDNTLFVFYSDNGGNTHSRTYDDRKLANVGPGHPQYDAIQDWRKWAGGEPPTNNSPLREGKGRIYEGGQRVPLMVRWPGRVEPGTTSDAVVGPIDLYPTILEATATERPEGHVLDGLSLLPVLEQTGDLNRNALFTWFPHLIPAVSVRAGDYKLIRRWEPHSSYPEVRELYDLSDDIGETNNLASKMPEKVAELEALIDAFIVDTDAVTPLPNPAYQPQAARAALNREPTWGLVPKSCEIEVLDDAIRITGAGRTPFLGTAQVRLSGPLTMRLRTRSSAGGRAKVQWKTIDQEAFPESGQTVEFDLPNGNEWHETKIDVPLEGRSGTVRLYLPANDSVVDVQLIEFAGKSDQTKAWDFAGDR
ncbi:sulfatase [Neorhodopirellula pilleata]|uniref:Arylsulfatase n=1 Tax=Neorhodopirellula pilleata TaxID=2714738 RepID=A0A5C6ATV8_9BACT|nr:sulfatase [Neorhodopirellula pilleata]TWU01584.1 Arylsulfatase [Neorhodopirellula pilleata]